MFLVYQSVSSLISGLDGMELQVLPEQTILNCPELLFHQ